MSRWPWRDPEYRRDILFVAGLFGIGLVLSATFGLVAMWFFQMFDWWDMPLDINLE